MNLFSAILIVVVFVSGFHWFAKHGQYKSAMAEFKANARYRTELDAFREKQGVFKSIQMLDTNDLATRRRLLADSERRFDHTVGLTNALRDIKPTWRDLLPLLIARAIYRRLTAAKRTPAQIEAHNAALRGWTLDVYRQRLAEHVLELSSRGELQPFIALANAASQTPVPVLPDDESEAAAEKSNEESRKRK